MLTSATSARPVRRTSCLATARCGNESELNSAGKNVPPKPPITQQAVPRMLERRGPIVFEEKMTHPGKCVSLQKRHRNQPPRLRDSRGKDQRDGGARADEVQPPAGPVCMLSKIKWVEIA